MQAMSELSKVEELQARLAFLLNLVKNHGRHWGDCDKWAADDPKCSCWVADALSEELADYFVKEYNLLRRLEDSFDGKTISISDFTMDMLEEVGKASQRRRRILEELDRHREARKQRARE